MKRNTQIQIKVIAQFENNKHYYYLHLNYHIDVYCRTSLD